MTSPIGRKCQACGVELRFARSPAGAMIPLQRIRTVYRIVAPEGELKAVLVAKSEPPIDLYVSHFETCRAASRGGRVRPMGNDLVARLRDSGVALRFSGLGTEWQELANQAADAIERLRAEVVELRRDRERLSWIGEKCGGVGSLVWEYFGASELLLDGGDGKDLRAAIDAAREAESRE